MAKKRESITFSEYQMKCLVETLYFEEDEDSEVDEDKEIYEALNATYVIIKNKMTDAGYKNSSTHEVILHRITDNKFFKGEYTFYHSADQYSDDNSFDEVFPKQVTKTVYK
jgi:hypothetical protein